MGTNVIYLAERAAALSIPAYRRAPLHATVVTASSPAAAPAPASWVAAAQRRAAQRLASIEASRAQDTVLLEPRLGRPDSATPTHGLPDLPDLPNSSTGRLRLTGRLVDVCAELERLAQAEAVADAMARRA